MALDKRIALCQCQTALGHRQRIQIQRCTRRKARRERTPGFSEQMAAVIIVTEMGESVNSARILFSHCVRLPSDLTGWASKAILPSMLVEKPFQLGPC